MKQKWNSISLFCVQIVFLVFISSSYELVRNGAGSSVRRSKGFQLWTVLDVPLFFPFPFPSLYSFLKKDLSCSLVSKPCRQNCRKVWLLNTFCITPPMFENDVATYHISHRLFLFQMLILLLGFRLVCFFSSGKMIFTDSASLYINY